MICGDVDPLLILVSIIFCETRGFSKGHGVLLMVVLPGRSGPAAAPQVSAPGAPAIAGEAAPEMMARERVSMNMVIEISS